ncbi:MAG: hypothetical protein HUU45_15135 [Leptospiraceae bacterium]|nr:hypothetical protein [Leptospiraceae bacterium]
MNIKLALPFQAIVFTTIFHFLLYCRGSLIINAELIDISKTSPGNYTNKEYEKECSIREKGALFIPGENLQNYFGNVKKIENIEISQSARTIFFLIGPPVFAYIELLYCCIELRYERK